MAKTLSLDDWLDPGSATTWAITSSKQPVYMAYWFNRLLGLELERSPRDLILERNNLNFSFIQFQFVDPLNTFTWFLVENRSYTPPSKEATLLGNTEIQLIKRGFRIDYLFQVTGEGAERVAPEWKELIKRGVAQAATPILDLTKKEEHLLHFEQYEHE